jgi:molecular chaperone GrpE
MAKKHKEEPDKKDEKEVKAESEPAQSEPTLQGAVAEAAAVPALIPEEEIEQLRAELELVKQKENEYLNGWQRERAEFFNYKKRTEREQAQGGQNAFASAIRRYLDIADDLDRALKSKNRPTEGEAGIWANGIDLIHRKMLAAFDADGIKLIETDGKSFDPNMHEAISSEDSPNHSSGQIIEVVQAGYTLGDRVIRPARVRVAR